MPVVNIFKERVENFNKESEKRLKEELFGNAKSEEEWETYSIDEVADILSITKEEAKDLFNCKIFNLYRVGNEYRAKKKSVEDKEKILKAAFNYRDKKTMSVGDLGRILALGKTCAYRLVNKCYFKSYLICGVLRVDTESFDDWYASQFHYKKVDGERPGKKYGNTYSSTTLGKVLGIAKSTGYDLLNSGQIEYIVIDGKRRITDEAFWKWYTNQDKYKMVKTLEEAEGYVY